MRLGCWSKGGEQGRLQGHPLLGSCGLGGGHGIRTRQETVLNVTLFASLGMLQAMACPKVPEHSDQPETLGSQKERILGGGGGLRCPPWTAPPSLGLEGPEGLARGTEVGEEGSREQRRPRLPPPSLKRGLE